MTELVIDKMKKTPSPTIPNALGEVCTLGGHVADGLEAHGAEAGIK